MKKYSILFLVLLMITVLLSGCGKGIIIGKVIDENNDPIIGAQIVTDPPTFSKITTAEGFEMKNVPVGVYTISASKTGYSKKDVEIKVFKKRTTTADIQLKKSSK